jgi:hypothetical protein
MRPGLGQRRKAIFLYRKLPFLRAIRRKLLHSPTMNASVSKRFSNAPTLILNQNKTEHLLSRQVLLMGFQPKFQSPVPIRVSSFSADSRLIKLFLSDA